MTNVGRRGLWRIEARAFRIFHSPITHNFWILVNSREEIAQQLHGLAVDPDTGAEKMIGTSKDLLQVVSRKEVAWAIVPGQPVKACAVGEEAEINLCWQAALQALQAINALKLPYPDLHQHFSKLNSNSIFYTLGRVMGFQSEVLTLSTIAPGNNKIISQEIIDKYGYSSLQQ